MTRKALAPCSTPNFLRKQHGVFQQNQLKATRSANFKKSSIRARVEHVFAHQKNRFGLLIRTIHWPTGDCRQSPRGGLARAEAKLALAKLALANLAYNFDRLIFQERRYAMG